MDQKQHTSLFNMVLFLFVSVVLLQVSNSCQKFEPERVILVKTAPSEDITLNSCKLNGVIDDMGSQGISEHGFYYSLSSERANAFPPLSLGATSKRGAFTEMLSGLSPGTTYYVWAYAAMATEREFGDPVSFTTLPATVPEVETGDVLALESTSAEINCRVVADGGLPVTERGICWDSIINPGKEKAHSAHGTGTGAYIGTLSDLVPGRTYYARAYAINESGTSYGENREITTPMTIVPPELKTAIVSEISWNSAVSGGEITSDGGSEILEKGICWSLMPDPTLSDSKALSQTPGLVFELALTDLLPESIYYVRAFARNSAGTAFGETREFATIETPQVPSVITLNVDDIGHYSATSGGTITSDGGAPIQSRGLCWSSTEQEPTLANFQIEYENEDDPFVMEILDLTPYTTYFVRAYASNELGIGYGETVEFRTLFLCGSQLVDERDGQSYFTVQIGEQCWMAENLNVGDELNIADAQSDNNIIEKYCYANDEQNCDQFGGQYSWDEMMQYSEIESSQGVCPAGWHIPSDYEWKIMEISLGMPVREADAADWRGSDEGGKLKSGGTSLWNPPNTGASNSSMFSALPAGMVFHEGKSMGLGDFAVFWTSTPMLDTQAWYRYLHTDESRIYRVDGYRPNTTSVRCVKD